MDQNGGASGINVATHLTEETETTIEIKVKTLDSHTYTLRVNKRVPVPLLKAKIADVTGIVSERQRLICRGKVLKDDDLLSAYHVEDGHTLHLVSRQPIVPIPPILGSIDPTSSAAPNAARPNEVPVMRTIVVETINGTLPTVGQVIPDSLATMTRYLEFMRNEFSRAGFSQRSMDGNVDPSNPGAWSSRTRDLNQRPNGLPSATLLGEIMQATRELLRQQADACLSQLSGMLAENASITDHSMRMNLQVSATRTGILLQNLGSLLLELGRAAMMLWMGQPNSEALVNAGPAVFISPSGPNPLMVQPVPFFPAAMNSARLDPLLYSQSFQSEFGAFQRSGDGTLHIHPGLATSASNHDQPEQVGSLQGQSNPRTMSQHTVSLSPHLSIGIMGPLPSAVPRRAVVANPTGVTPRASDPFNGSIGVICPFLSGVMQAGPSDVGNATAIQAPPNEAGDSHVNQQNSFGSSSQCPPVVPGAQNQTGLNFGHVILGSASESSASHPESQGPQNAPVQPANIQDPFLHLFQTLGALFSQQQVPLGNANHQDPVPTHSEELPGSNSTNVESRETGAANSDAILFSDMLRQVMPFIDSSGPQQQPGSGRGSGSEAARDDSDQQSGSLRHQSDHPDAPDVKRQRRDS